MTSQEGWGAFVHGIAAILGSVPIAAWTAGIGAGTAVVSIIVSNRFNDRRDRRTLKHASDLHEQRLKADFRKDVYLAAASALVNSENYLLSLNDTKLDDLGPLTGLHPLKLAVTQMAMVSSTKVSIAMGEVFEAYGAYIVDEMENILDLRRVNSERELLKNRGLENREERMRIIREQGRRAEAAERDSERASALQRMFELHTGWQREDEANWASVDARRTKMVIAQTKRSFETIEKVSEAALQALLGIRTEIGMQPDLDAFEEAYRARMARMRARTMARWDKLGLDEFLVDSPL